MPPDFSTNTPLWETGDDLLLPVLRGVVDTDICVVGLGGSGLACLSELRSAGVRALGLDAGQVAGGASGRNGGFLRAGLAAFHHDAVRRFGRARAVRLYRLTMAERERMRRDTPAEIRVVGYLRRAVDAEEEGDCRRHFDALRADDLPGEWLDGPSGRGVFVGEDAACNPLSRCRALARQLLADGVQLFEHSRAEAISGDRIETAEGMVRCRAVVVAVDGGLTTLFPELAGAARPTRLQMLGTAPIGRAVAPHATAERWGWDYWQQTTTGALALGGCRDAALDDEWTDGATPTAAVQEALDQRLQALGVDTPVRHRWAANVSYTESGLPVLREVRRRVWAVGGYCGTGNLVGAVAARAAAHLALGTEVDPFV